MTQDETVGWHHSFSGHEFEKTRGDSQGQGSLVCCRQWDHKELDTTERLNKKTALPRLEESSIFNLNTMTKADFSRN